MATKYLNPAVQVLKQVLKDSALAGEPMTAPDIIDVAQKSPLETGWNPDWDEDSPPASSLRRGLMEAIALGENEDVKNVKCFKDEKQQPRFYYQKPQYEVQEIHDTIDRILYLKSRLQNGSEERIGPDCLFQWGTADRQTNASISAVLADHLQEELGKGTQVEALLYENLKTLVTKLASL